MSVLYALLFSPYRGLFYSAPWLLLAVPGVVRLWRSRYRAETLVIVSVAVLYLLLNAGLTDWHGGWAAGPRHLVPALPCWRSARPASSVDGAPPRAERDRLRRRWRASRRR